MIVAAPDPSFAPGIFPHRALTGGALIFALFPRRSGVDIVFIVVIAALYAVSHWIVWAISRLGGDS